ncbi:MAG: hypothetical protein J6M06_01905 [Synergistaceae bacterium]|nr:hypothetical protein [Synergistaceae bacterium]
MSEAKNVFKTEVRERAALARNARNAYSKRRRGCRFPSDGLTKKEWEKMNGPIREINLNAPIGWEAFRELPVDLQKEYLDHVFARFSVGPAALAKMFGISKPYCGEYLRGLGYSFKERTRVEEAARFFEAYGKPDRKRAESKIALQRIELTFAGEFAPEMIAAKLSGLFSIGQEAVITITVEAR